jgi:glycosyltransferase involved in cell wall biosynthesis
MRVCGFTFIRNARKYGYPVVESIRSILPVCDKLIVAAGNSDDDTLSMIQSIGDKKIEIIQTIWDDNLRAGGTVLTVETNKAFDAIPAGYDWCFYIQGDEVIHEKYLETIRSSMEKYLSVPEVEGLLFNYKHFYGSYRYVADSRSWYRKEIRIIRNDKSIRSFKDAQGFRKNGKKLKVKQIQASVYHYGWVRPPQLMQDKVKDFHALWHSDDWIKKNTDTSELFDYTQVDSIEVFKESHPAVMQSRISESDWDIELDTRKKNLKWMERMLYKIEKHTGYRMFEYKNYSEVRS